MTCPALIAANADCTPFLTVSDTILSISAAMRSGLYFNSNSLAFRS